MYLVNTVNSGIRFPSIHSSPTSLGARSTDSHITWWWRRSLDKAPTKQCSPVSVPVPLQIRMYKYTQEGSLGGFCGDWEFVGQWVKVRACTGLSPPAASVPPSTIHHHSTPVTNQGGGIGFGDRWLIDNAWTGDYIGGGCRVMRVSEYICFAPTTLMSIAFQVFSVCK